MASPQPNRRERGVALITTSMVLVPLMIFAAFGVDLAGWYSRLTDLQRAADAAALAGAVWMPDLSKATAEAEDSLESNGIVHGVDFMVVDIERGATPTSIRVTVTDNDAERYFSQIVASGPQSLTRFAEAEYNLPLPLGSPLNYFAGDATRTQPTTVINYSVTWPPDYTTRRPRTVACNVGTSAAQGLGRWNSSGSYEASGFSASSPICGWAASGENPSGVSAVPPPDYTTRPPTNSNDCRVAQNGTGPTILGRWQSGAFSTSTGGSAPFCTWDVLSTVLSTVHPNYDSSPPTGQPCRVGYEASLGWWSSNVFSTAGVPTGVAASAGNRLCTWSATVSSVDSTPPNPIDASRSPGFWALIEGPGTVATQGDAYTPRCYINPNCGSVENASHRNSDDTRGYWYIVKIPSGLTGSVRIEVFDASNHPSGSQTSLSGDSSINVANQSFQTEYRVFEQTNPLEFTERVPVSIGPPNTTPGSCYWRLGSESAFRGAWTELCTLSSVAPGDTFLINVRTNGTTGSGINGYAVQACANGSCTSGAQPALYAYSDMAMYNNIAGGDATFYLAEVGPQYAGRVLVIELWDAGDASGNATLYPMRPSASALRPVMNVPENDCTYTSSPTPNTIQSSSAGGPTGFVHSTPRPSDDPGGSGVCAVRTTIGGARQFNGEWLRIRVNIPVDYTCTQGVNPETTAGSCWWGIRYSLSAQATDVTTWQARIEGNPLQLTQ